MRIQICAVGRLKSSPEKQLLDDYLSRLDAAGRGIGITAMPVAEVEEKRRHEGAELMEREAVLLTGAIPKGALIVALDERGRVETSEAFAKRLGNWRDTGTSDIAFVIGGANGLAPSLRDHAAHIMAFGAMTWPHMLARVMLAEQLYRAVTILSGHPYHRA
ncbi:23S rRNA (pseudouridine(1915)-N(3))-methyltransferase RlmH [Parvibaculum sp.]|jgi:23S rRNA (pseudouridine1915-N3)-methyltransferase|uniref:23S rRNA (pseudouridine(1915)-N(3))-methyltransferase RlmH n=1 Tax=Parvibaculum sp. TaxID=2024848 RepID=UPI000C3B6D1E|nr:23S rRNA (pseudouridine(1915)-N(3))-methyltransferase RlmH [Parvibaculum sp.]MAM96088.1 23S rRNA (pseudouridine(1915)-N(3))-methyltransferase RlmH [Parvibaculum sp.]HCX66174.1 23S rRNA (pseudouridine(1915)-N(3))-methyltransferase RlmH [Rhodobiaceae bacterium]|tara:strand:- start:200 stop:682 length:483 start_codon:yes stop_codon:yes gene_type:complete